MERYAGSRSRMESTIVDSFDRAPSLINDPALLRKAFSGDELNYIERFIDIEVAFGIDIFDGVADYVTTV